MVSKTRARNRWSFPIQ